MSSSDSHGSASPASPPPSAAATAAPNSDILTGKKLVIVFASMMLALFLIALDQTILATALPRIASDFNAFSEQGWVSAAFIMTQTACLLIFGQGTRIWRTKYVLLAGIFIFELGSLICAVSQNVTTLIVGRAVSGLGAAAMLISLIQVISQSTLLEDRPQLMGLFGAVYGLSSIIGPLIGGAFTDNVGWRWCFWINLPVGGLAFAVIMLVLPSTRPMGSSKDGPQVGVWRQTLKMDWIGAVLNTAAVILLVVGLQWGGNSRPWKDAGVIATLVISVILFGSLIAWAKYLGPERAMLPLTVFKSVSIYAIITNAFLSRFGMLLFTYYIPVYEQAAKGTSAIESGIRLLPLILSLVITGIVAGQLIARVIGRYWHILVFGPFPQAIGAGLFYTITPHSSGVKVSGYQVLVGVGVGAVLQNSFIAMQAEFNDDPKLLGQASAMISFAQFLGGTIGLTVSSTVFTSTLGDNLHKYAPNATQYYHQVRQSVTDIHNVLPVDLRAGVIMAYVKSLRTVFLLGAVAGTISALASFWINNIRISGGKPADIESQKGKDGPPRTAGVEGGEDEGKEKGEDEFRRESSPISPDAGRMISKGLGD